MLLLTSTDIKGTISKLNEGKEKILDIRRDIENRKSRAQTILKRMDKKELDGNEIRVVLEENFNYRLLEILVLRKEIESRSEAAANKELIINLNIEFLLKYIRYLEEYVDLDNKNRETPRNTYPKRTIGIEEQPEKEIEILKSKREIYLTARLVVTKDSLTYDRVISNLKKEKISLLDHLLHNPDKTYDRNFNVRIEELSDEIRNWEKKKNQKLPVKLPVLVAWTQISQEEKSKTLPESYYSKVDTNPKKEVPDEKKLMDQIIELTKLNENFINQINDIKSQLLEDGEDIDQMNSEGAVEKRINYLKSKAGEQTLSEVYKLVGVERVGGKKSLIKNLNKILSTPKRLKIFLGFKPDKRMLYDQAAPDKRMLYDQAALEKKLTEIIGEGNSEELRKILKLGENASKQETIEAAKKIIEKDDLRNMLGISEDADAQQIKDAVLRMQTAARVEGGVSRQSYTDLKELLGLKSGTQVKLVIPAAQALLGQLPPTLDQVKARIRNALHDGTAAKTPLADDATPQAIADRIAEVLDENGSAIGGREEDHAALMTLLGAEANGKTREEIVKLVQGALNRLAPEIRIQQVDRIVREAAEVKTQIKDALRFVNGEEVNEGSIRDKIAAFRAADNTAENTDGITRLAKLLGVDLDDDRFTALDEADGSRAAAIDAALLEASKENLGLNAEALRQANEALEQALRDQALDLANLAKTIDLLKANLTEERLQEISDVASKAAAVQKLFGAEEEITDEEIAQKIQALVTNFSDENTVKLDELKAALGLNHDATTEEVIADSQAAHNAALALAQNLQQQAVLSLANLKAGIRNALHDGTEDKTPLADDADAEDIAARIAAVLDENGSAIGGREEDHAALMTLLGAEANGKTREEIVKLVQGALNRLAPEIRIQQVDRIVREAAEVKTQIKDALRFVNGEEVNEGSIRDKIAAFRAADNTAENTDGITRLAKLLGVDLDDDRFTALDEADGSRAAAIDAALLEASKENLGLNAEALRQANEALEQALRDQALDLANLAKTIDLLKANLTEERLQEISDVASKAAAVQKLFGAEEEITDEEIAQKIQALVTNFSDENTVKLDELKAALGLNHDATTEEVIADSQAAHNAALALAQNLQQQAVLSLANLKAGIRNALHDGTEDKTPLADDADAEDIAARIAAVLDENGSAIGGREEDHAALIALLGDEAVGNLAAKTTAIKRILNQMDPLAVRAPAPATLAQVKDRIRAVLGNLALDANQDAIRDAIAVVMNEDGTSNEVRNEDHAALMNLLGDEAIGRDREAITRAIKRTLDKMDAAAIEAVRTQIKNALGLQAVNDVDLTPAQVTDAVTAIIAANGNVVNADAHARLQALLGADDGANHLAIVNASKRILNQMDAPAVEAVRLQIKNALNLQGTADNALTPQIVSDAVTAIIADNETVADVARHNRLQALLGADDGANHLSIVNASKRILNQMDAAAIEALQTQIKTSLRFAATEEINETTIKEKIAALRAEDTTREDNAGINNLAKLLGVDLADARFTTGSEAEKSAAIDAALTKAAKDNLGLTIEGLERDLEAQAEQQELQRKAIKEDPFGFKSSADAFFPPSGADVTHYRRQNPNSARLNDEAVAEKVRQQRVDRVTNGVKAAVDILDKGGSISDIKVEENLKFFLSTFAHDSYWSNKNSDLTQTKKEAVEQYKKLRVPFEENIRGKTSSNGISIRNLETTVELFFPESGSSRQNYRRQNPESSTLDDFKVDKKFKEQMLNRVTNGVRTAVETFTKDGSLNGLSSESLRFFLCTFAYDSYLDGNLEETKQEAIAQYSSCDKSALNNLLRIPERSPRADSSTNVVNGRTIARPPSAANNSFPRSLSRSTGGGASLY